MPNRIGGTTPTTTTTATSTTKTKSGSKTPIARGSIEVAVLNGTTVTGLAAQLADQLKQAGFKQPTSATGPNQTVQTTIVGYLPGQKRAAQEVAKVLKVKTVTPVDATSKAVACASGCPGLAAVVTVGLDHAQ